MSQKIPRKQQAIETKMHILKSAITLMEDTPFEQVTIADICKFANVSTGAFYHYFPSKECIIFEQYKLFDIDLVNFAMEYTDSDPIERIINFICTQVSYAQSVGLKLTVSIYRAQLDFKNSNEDFLFSEERGIKKGLNILLENAQKSGYLKKELDIHAVSTDILIVSRGVIYYWCQRNGEFDISQKTEQIIRVFLNNYLI